MFKSFNWFRLDGVAGPALWLRVAILALLLLNLVALYLYVVPPGGTRSELEAQSNALKQDIQLHRASATRLKTVSRKVQAGSRQDVQFVSDYFLPRRTASSDVLSELLRMSAAAGLHEGQRTYSNEPVEGSDDLTLVTINANYQGNYAELMKFVHEVDRSDRLLILDQMTATPQQQGSSDLNVVTRFLVIVKDETNLSTGDNR